MQEEHRQKRLVKYKYTWWSLQMRVMPCYWAPLRLSPLRRWWRLEAGLWCQKVSLHCARVLIFLFFLTEVVKLYIYIIIPPASATFVWKGALLLENGWITPSYIIPQESLYPLITDWHKSQWAQLGCASHICGCRGLTLSYIKRAFF